MKIDKKITRIDLEAITDYQTRAKMWPEGWNEGDMPSGNIVWDGDIVQLLLELEDMGFTCEMASKELGRALRGKTTRVDLLKKADGWHYLKFPYGWTAKTRPISDEIRTEEEVNEILAWCKAHDWQVYEWTGIPGTGFLSGARAFKGQPMPVRDAISIKSMRRVADRVISEGLSKETHLNGTNFALFY